ncbi:MAG: cation:proton antiporter, partial [Methanomassiliicoccales archaeon]
FMSRKAISVSFASYVANLDIRTSFHAGLNMIVMGEFSFIIAKMAVDTGAAGEFFYSTVISIALITALVYPLSVAKSDTIVDIFEKRTPRSVKAALSLIERLRAAMREKIASSNDLRKSIMKDIKWIFIDMTIIFVVTAAANYLYNYTGLMHDLSGVSPFLPLLLVSSITVILLIPPIYSIVRRIRAIVGVAVHIVLETGSYNSIGKKMIEKVFMNLFTIFIVIVSFVYLLSIVPIPPNMPYISPLVVIFVGIGVALVFRSTLKSVHQKMSVLLSKGIMDEREDSRRIK